MIDKLHSITNKILGIGSIKNESSKYKLTISSSSEIYVTIINNSAVVIKPESTFKCYTYKLTEGKYIINVFSDALKEERIHHEEIIVTSDMLSTSRNIIIN